MRKRRGKLAYIYEILKSYPEIKNKSKKSLTIYEERRIEVIESTLNEISKLNNGAEILKTIDLLFFSKKLNQSGVGMKLNVSQRTVQSWVAKVVEILEKKMDLY